ncbi:NaeI family type II restriction endonuclease [Paenibacillus whitsoniae]|uniref:NaeI family type II restriction endonuclease n=1 Tax=Paenibacillus whitsoniae TaxID=2496558 RepID=UPI0013E0E544|nr:NaeI family type II restriction endonuclease [Paenibacillus whitsoniae]
MQQLNFFTENTDQELDKVITFLKGIPNFERKLGRILRKSIDEVVNGRYTGRYSIEQLDKTEKTYIGTRVQHMLQHELDLPYGEVMDALVDGIEVDIKFTIGKNWTIPLEADGHICLLISADDNKSIFQAGCLRISSEVLNSGKNRDSKRTINAEGRELITWLVSNGSLPGNALLKLDPEVIKKVYSKKSGQERINELFRSCPGIVFNGAAIESVAMQKDSSKRVRDARNIWLKPEGISIYSGKYDNDKLLEKGLSPLEKDEFMSFYDLESETN